MSKYTTELRFICEMKSGFSEEELAVKPIADIIEAARPAVFNFQYPLYDPTHKQDLETKIIKHYYTREIAAETFALWHLWLDSRMNDIMPKYNKLYQWEHDILNKELQNIDVTYESERTDDLLRTDSFTRTDNLSEEIDSTRTDNLSEDTDSTRTDNLTDDSDVTRTDNLREQSTVTRTDNLEEDITASDTEKRKFSDTPQGSVNFNDELDQGNYWLTDYTETTRETESERTNTGTQTTVSDTTNTGTQRTLGSVDHTGTQRTQTSRDNTGTQRTQTERDNTGTQTNAGTSANTGTQETLTHEYGYRGSKTYMELLAEYQDKILNIDLMIIRELNDLFFMLW